MERNLGFIGFVALFLLFAGMAEAAELTECGPVTEDSYLGADITHDGSGDECFSIEADGITFDGNGYSISGNGEDAGMRAQSRSGVTIINHDISNFADGINLYTSSGNILAENSVSGSTYGINAFMSHGNSISGSTFNSNDYGAYIIYSHNTSLIDNTASGNMIGLYFSGSDGSIIEENEVTSSGDSGIRLYDSHESTVSENTIDSSGSYGILIYNAEYNDVMDNSISNTMSATSSYGGIYLVNSNNNEAYGNEFIDNEVQAYVDGDSEDNLFSRPKEEGGGNHWNDWTSPDENSDGFVDEPYVFEGGQDDWPLVYPRLKLSERFTVTDYASYWLYELDRTEGDRKLAQLFKPRYNEQLKAVSLYLSTAYDEEQEVTLEILQGKRPEAATLIESTSITVPAELPQQWTYFEVDVELSQDEYYWITLNDGVTEVEDGYAQWWRKDDVVCLGGFWDCNYKSYRRGMMAFTVGESWGRYENADRFFKTWVEIGSQSSSS